MDDSLDWSANKIDRTQDEFVILHAIFEEKFANDFKTKEYRMLEL